MIPLGITWDGNFVLKLQFENLTNFDKILMFLTEPKVF